jgi:P4 family phage/plasmid primase-like protien
MGTHSPSDGAGAPCSKFLDAPGAASWPQIWASHFIATLMSITLQMATEVASQPVVSEAKRRAEATQFLKLIDHPRLVVRTLPDSRELYGEWSEVDDLSLQAIELSQPPAALHSAAGVYVVINPTKEDAFLEFANGKGDGKAIADRHIERRTGFYVDIDPTRRHPDGGKVCANDDERIWAESAMERVVLLGAFHGLSEPLVVDSGNGYQIHYRVDLPNDDGSKSLVKSVLQRFASFIDCDLGKVDTSVCNAARLARLPGTYNHKGPHTADRPHRLAKIVSAPADGVLKITVIETLRAFATTTAPLNALRPKTKVGAPSCEIEVETHRQLVEEVQKYLSENDAPAVASVTESSEKTVLTFEFCPFRGPDHADGGAAVLVWRSGAVGLKCFHDACVDLGWGDLQKKLGPTFQSDALFDYAGRHRDQIHRTFKDPYVLSEKHLDETRLAGGEPSLVYVSNQMYQYWPTGGWRPVMPGELTAPVRSTIQSAFDAEYLSHPWINHAPVVTPQIVNSTVKALESAAHFPTDPTQMPPFWLSDGYDADPMNLLVMRNGIVDVMAFAEGQECFYPTTPHLFTQGIGQYDYNPECREAPSWFGFLESLEQDDKWHMLLQEMIGCWLCGGCNLQKIFMLVGPPRCGKGTIQQVVEGLLGHQNVCSPNLIDFAKPFGLEQAIGTRLAIVPEVAFPPRETQQIVASLKAISGGDKVTVDRKHIKNISLRLPMKIVLVTNNFIALPDNSKALPSRIVPLRFSKSFLGQEDLALSGRLANELPSILNWALEGFRRLHQNGGKFTLPNSTVELMGQLLYESAPLQSFVQDACVLDPRKGVLKQSLHERYKEWKKANDPDGLLLSAADFTRELQAAVSHLAVKRASNRNLEQGSYQIIPTPHDAKIESRRPEVWVGIYCRQDG